MKNWVWFRLNASILYTRANIGEDSLQQKKSAVQVDDVVTIRQLTKRAAVDGAEEMGLDLDKATGGDAATEDLTSKLSRVVQLTGFSGKSQVCSKPNIFTNTVRLRLLRSICQSPAVRHRPGRTLGQSD